MHSRLKGTTLQLSFHLAVKTRVRLLAKRGRRVIAKTAAQVFKAGTRTLSLRLNPHLWPNKLDLETHALAKLPVVSSVTGPGANVGTESTGELALPDTALLREASWLP